MTEETRHKADWDYVEWLLKELSAQLMPGITKRKAKREKARLAVAEYRRTPEGYMKHLEYSRRYNAKHSLELKKKRLENRLAQIQEEYDRLPQEDTQGNLCGQ